MQSSESYSHILHTRHDRIEWGCPSCGVLRDDEVTNIPIRATGQIVQYRQGGLFA